MPAATPCACMMALQQGNVGLDWLQQWSVGERTMSVSAEKT